LKTPSTPQKQPPAKIAVFSHVKGVKSAVSGYHGGVAGNAKYNRIIAGGTNHAEAVKITYDPYVVRYDELLRIFFSVVADPTLKNRQGPDVGPHYRTALVPLNAEQRAVASAYLKQMGASRVWKRPIVTRIESHKKFYPAETYHQDFMAKNPRHGYIVRWDAPKVRALRAMFPSDYRSKFLRDG
ncbi:MAG: peptide-methionine (S)-S-oxide reductase MsrA, partial [Pseudomonadota bacterium]